MSPPLQLAVSIDHPRVARATTTRVRVVAEVVADDAPRAGRPPCALVLALDTSGSMEGAKLRHLQRSVELVVDHLSPRDRLGVVAFSDVARVVAPLASRSAWRPELVAALRAGGGTSIEAGLTLAASLAELDGGEARGLVVLLSDGQPNIGASTPEALAALARRLRDRVSISTLGYGEDHSDAALAAIAELAGGGYAFIPNPEQCRVELARVVGAQVDVVADRVRVELEPVRGVTGAGEVRLCDVGAGDRRVVTFDLELPAFATNGSFSLGRVALRFRSADGEQVALVAPIAVEVGDHAGPRAAAAHALGLLREGELARAEAARLIEAGQLDAAARGLARCRDRVGAALADAAEPRLSELYEQLADDLALVALRPDADARSAYRRGQAGLSPTHASAMLASAYGAVPNAILVRLDDRGAAPITLGGETTFGRTGSADVQLASSRVSRLHTRIVAADGAFWVNDLGSSTGTRLNGAQIRSQRLRDGDVIEIGDVKLLFRDA